MSAVNSLGGTGVYQRPIVVCKQCGKIYYEPDLNKLKRQGKMKTQTLSDESLAHTFDCGCTKDGITGNGLMAIELKDGRFLDEAGSQCRLVALEAASVAEYAKKAG